MRVGIDAHTLGRKAGGNETYMRQLLHALSLYAPDQELIALIDRDCPPENVPHGIQTACIPVRSSYLRVPFALPRMAKRLALDLLHVQYTAPPYCPCPYVVSMHDAVAVRYPETMPRADRVRLRWLTGMTLRRAARIFVLTHAMQREISQLYRIPEERFDVVTPVLDPRFHPSLPEEEKQRVREKYRLPEKFILYLGLLQPRKNLVRLAEAFARLVSRGYPHKLVFGGKRAWLYREMIDAIQRLGLGERIIFTDYVPDEDLPPLIASADVFAYVSLYEGFGIPVLEALACGVPTLTSEDPALVEVSGGAALHVNAFDVEAIAAGLQRLIDDEFLRARLRAAGPVRASTFTPVSMATAALDGYRKALSR